MHISLVGMSNIGKSHWARRLAAESGFEWVECDDLIETKLADELVKQGYSGLSDVAKWMGQPYDPQYPYTSQKYMVCERDVMLEVIERLREPTTKPLVIDTTGSVIYAGDDIVGELRSLTRVAYLEATAAHVKKLFDQYIQDPKPVIWGDRFTMPEAGSLQQRRQNLLADRAKRYLRHVTHSKPVIWGDSFAAQAGETPEAALERCYPGLLRYRAERYQAMAHVTIPYEKHKARDAILTQLMADA